MQRNVYIYMYMYIYRLLNVCTGYVFYRPLVLFVPFISQNHSYLCIIGHLTCAVY